MHGSSGDIYAGDSVHPFYRPALLLFGISLEARTKAVLIHQSTANLQESMNKIPKQKSGHDLVALVENTGTSLTDDQKHALKRITNSILWMSKYHAPKDVSKRNGIDLIRNDNDYCAFLRIYEKVGSLLPRDLNA